MPAPWSQLTAESLLSEGIPFRLANISQKQSCSFWRMDTRKVMTEVRLFMFDVGGDLTIWRRIHYQISIWHSLIQLNPSWLIKENLVKTFEIVPDSLIFPKIILSWILDTCTIKVRLFMSNAERELADLNWNLWFF